MHRRRRKARGLAGSGTDPEGGTSYACRQSGDPTAALSDTSVVRSTFTASNVTTDIPMTFALAVNDGVSESASDTVMDFALKLRDADG